MTFIRSSEDLRASVIIPAFNAAHVLPDCLKALERQTLPRGDFEIIVVDDGSTDKTAQLAAASGARVLSQARTGPSAARNAGVAIAAAPIVVFTDADCVPAADFLERLLAPLSDVSVIGSRGVYRTMQQGIIARFVQIEYETRYRRIMLLAERDGTVKDLDTSYAAYRRQIFIDSGGFNEKHKGPGAEDHELSFRLAGEGHVMRMAADAVVYHQHVDNVRDYFKRKFRMGFWNAFTVLRYPNYAVSDPHQPPDLKFQVFLAGLMVLTVLSWPFWPGADWMLLGSLVIFAASGIPFLVFAANTDPPVTSIALPLLMVRALASGLGFLWGILRNGPVVFARS